MNGTADTAVDVPSYVTATARLMAMPLEGERFEAVVAVMERIATFARNLSAFEVTPDVEVAGVFRP